MPALRIVIESRGIFIGFLRVVASLSTVGMYTSGIGIFCMVFLITLEILGRYLFGFSMLVVDEWSGYLLVIVTFVGLAYTMKTNGFLQIEFFLNRMSSTQRAFFNIVLILIALVYSILIDYKLIVHTWSSYVTGVVSVSISQTPLYIPQLFMPVGMTLLILELLSECAQSLHDLLSGDVHKQQRGSTDIK